jgi:hypothetical protein
MSSVRLIPGSVPLLISLPHVGTAIPAEGRGAYRPRFRSTPKLDDISTTAWYLGWFEKQFVRKWATRAEYVELGETTESYLRSRVAYQARLAWNMEIGVQDHVYVVQSLSASTAPTAANVP